MALHSKKQQKVWIWKALDHDTGQLIDWECGPRDSRTLRKLLLRLKKRGVRVYLSDHFKVYSAEIQEEILIRPLSKLQLMDHFRVKFTLKILICWFCGKKGYQQLS